MEEESKTSSSVVPAATAVATSQQPLSGSLTARRGGGRRSTARKSQDEFAAHAPFTDSADGVRSLRGVAVGLRDVIPVVPVRARPFELDGALAALEAELTGIGGSGGGGGGGSFPPTNFYIQWPPEDERRAATANCWISPRDLLVAQTPRTKTARDFPKMLGIHEQRHQPGLLGFVGDLPLTESGAGSSRVGGHAAKHFTGRALNATMAEASASTTGVKRDHNRNVGPGSFEGPMTSAVLSRSTSTFKPKPPKRFDDLGLIQGPAPGTYRPRTPAKRVPALNFGGTSKTHSRLGAAMANQTGLIGSDAGGPGYYSPKEGGGNFGGEPTSLIFGRAARFADPSGASTIGQAIGAPIAHGPGPGQYNSTHGDIGAPGGREVVSFSAHGGGGSAAAAAVTFKRSLGPSVGSYDPNDGLDIGSSTVGSGHTVNTPRPLHKFSSSPRFQYHSRPHPLYALVISSAKQRSSELARNFAPDLSSFQSARREQLAEQAASARRQRQQSATLNRAKLREAHLETVDKIVHADVHRAAAREQKAVEEFQLFLRKGWLFYVALASRMQAIKENVRRVRTAKNLRLLTTNAARTIVTYARKWAAKARAKKTLRCGQIILRALRRNVVRASLRRKRRATRLLTILLLNRSNKVRALLAIARWKSQAVVIQRAARRYLERKVAATQGLLVRQWIHWENLLAAKFKTQEGEKAFEKIRKKGLLQKHMTLEQQRAKIIADVPFDLIESRLRAEIIEEDYVLRLRAHRHALYEWKRLKRRHEGLPDLVSIVDGAIASKARKTAEMYGKMSHLSHQTGVHITTLSGVHPPPTPPVGSRGQGVSMSMVVSPTIVAWNLSASYAASALSSGLPAPPPFDPHRPPVFARLVSPLRLYMLLTSAQHRQAVSTAEALGVPLSSVLDLDQKKRYKTLIGALLKLHAVKEAKDKRARERARDKDGGREGLTSAAASSGGATPLTARSPIPPPRRTLATPGSSSARTQRQRPTM